MIKLTFKFISFSVLFFIFSGCGLSKDEKIGILTMDLRNLEELKISLDKDLSELNAIIRNEQMIISNRVSLEYQKDRAKMSPVEKNGELLFSANCFSCHVEGNSTLGPSLAHISKTRDRAWLIKFIRNSQELILSGDSLANKIYLDNDMKVMTSFENLSNQDISAILKFIEYEFNKPDKLAILSDSLDAKYQSQINKLNHQIDSVSSLISFNLSELQRLNNN